MAAEHSNPQERAVVIFAALGHGLFHILAGLFATVVLVLEPIWRLPYDQLISLWTIGALLVGFGAPIAGWLGDRFGETRVMIGYFLGMGAAAVGCGLAEGPRSLEAMLALMGLAGAVYHPVGTAWIVKNGSRRGRTIARVGIAGSVGIALASLVAATLSDAGGWRSAFIVPGLATIVVGIALAAAYATGRIVDRTHDAVPQPEPERGDVRRAFVVLVITMALTSIVYNAFTTLLPKWIERDVGAGIGGGITRIGALVTLIYLAGSLAQIAGGAAADRGWAKTAYCAAFAVKLAALGLVTQVGGWPIVPAAMIMVFVFDMATTIESVLIARYTSAARRGLAYGARFGIGVIAAPLGVQLVARLFDPAAGFRPLLGVLAVVILVVLVAACFLPNDGRVGPDEVPLAPGAAREPAR